RVARRIDRPPEPVLPAANAYHHLVHMPFVARGRAISTDIGRDLRPETATPDPDGLVADHDAALGQKILDVSQAQGKPMVEPDGIADDAAWKAMALQPSRIRR